MKLTGKKLQGDGHNNYQSIPPTPTNFSTPDKFYTSVNVTRLYWDNPDEMDGIQEQVVATVLGMADDFF